MNTVMSRREVLKAGALAAGTLAVPGALAGSAGLSRAEAAPPVTLTATTTADPGLLGVWRGMAKAFHREHPAINVTVLTFPDPDYDQKIDLMLAAGTPPALWWAAGNKGYRYYAARGYFPSIDAQIARDHISFGDYWKPSLDIVKWQGHLVGLPSDLKTSFLVYNKTLFDQAKLPYPPTDWADRSWDYDKFLEYAKALTVRRGGKTVQWGTDGPYTDGRYPFEIFGGDLFARQASVSGYPTPQQITLNTPAVVDGLQFMRDLILKWKVQPTAAESAAVQGGAPSLFQTGKIGMEATAGWNLLPYTAITNFEWGIAALPWPPKRYGLPRSIQIYPNQWMVFKGQKYPEQAWELQKWFAGTEGERLYSSLRITIPARKSLAGVFKAKLKAANPRLTTAEVDCVVNAVPYGHAGFGYALVNWAPISDLAVTPVLDKLWLGQLTGKQAVAEMISKVKAVLKQYPAPH